MAASLVRSVLLQLLTDTHVYSACLWMRVIVSVDAILLRERLSTEETCKKIVVGEVRSNMKVETSKLWSRVLTSELVISGKLTISEGEVKVIREERRVQSFDH